MAWLKPWFLSPHICFKGSSLRCPPDALGALGHELPVEKTHPQRIFLEPLGERERPLILCSY